MIILAIMSFLFSFSLLLCLAGISSFQRFVLTILINNIGKIIIILVIIFNNI